MKKGLFGKTLLLNIMLLLLTGCVINMTPVPDVEVEKANSQFHTAVYANDEGSNGFFVKRVVNGVASCYNVSWNDQTNKIDNTTLNNGQLVFDTNDEHLQMFGITDFELLGVHIDTYYYVYFQANDKIYEYVLNYTNSSMLIFPMAFHYINFREVNIKLDGLNDIVPARYNSLIMELDDENLIDDIPNSNILGIYGLNYLYLDQNGYLVYQNISKTQPVQHVFIEDKLDIVHACLNSNYAYVLTKDNKVYHLNFEDLTMSNIESTPILYMTSTKAKNYFALVLEDKIVVYNYMLEPVTEIIPVQPTNQIVGIVLAFKGAASPKKLVLSLAYMNGNVLYQTVDEIKLTKNG